MDDYIINMIQEIVNGVTNLGGVGGALIQTPAQFNPTIYSLVTNICQCAVMPIAYVILAIVFTLELYNVSTRIDGAGGGTTLGAEIVFRVLVKFVLCKTAVDMTPQILNAIFQVSSSIIGNIQIGTLQFATGADMEELKESVQNSGGFMTKVMLCAQITTIWIVFKFTSMMITLITLARMIEIYIYTAIAAIPIATLGGGELSSIGKNFLKGFAAVSLQGAIIYIILKFFGAFVANIPVDTLSANNITDVLFQSLLYTFLLVLAVFSSGKFSKSICNAM